MLVSVRLPPVWPLMATGALARESISTVIGAEVVPAGPVQVDAAEAIPDPLIIPAIAAAAMRHRLR